MDHRNCLVLFFALVSCYRYIWLWRCEEDLRKNLDNFCAFILLRESDDSCRFDLRMCTTRCHLLDRLINSEISSFKRHTRYFVTSQENPCVVYSLQAVLVPNWVIRCSAVIKA